MPRYTYLNDLCAQFEKHATDGDKPELALQEKTRGYMMGWRDKASGKPRRTILESHLIPHYEKGYTEAGKEHARDEGVRHLHSVK